MKVTTVRFSADLWETVASEAERAGISASQFIREAALARAASAAGARGELTYEPPLTDAARDVATSIATLPEHQHELQLALAALGRAATASVRSDAEALRAESAQARRATRETRARSAEQRANRQG